VSVGLAMEPARTALRHPRTGETVAWRLVPRCLDHLACAFGIVLMTVGCAHRPPVPSKVTFGPRTELGTIAVVAQAAPNPGRLGGPMTRGQSAGDRAIDYSATSIYLGGLLGWAGAVVAIFALPVTAAVGGIVGATEGERASDVQAARAPLERALIEAEIARTLCDRVAALGAERTRETFVVLPVGGNDSASARLPDAARTLLELRILAVRLALPDGAGGAGKRDPDPSLAFTMKTRLRVVRIADGTEIFARDVDASDEIRRFSEWIADDGRRFRDALAAAIETIAARVVGEVF
jgi:hypothetical protein